MWFIERRRMDLRMMVGIITGYCVFNSHFAIVGKNNLPMINGGFRKLLILL